MEKIKPLKRFGQNYLNDQNILNNIVKEINPNVNDNLLEIGPGLGSLTEKLLNYIPNLTAVEIDKRVIENLSNKFPQINLINDDFLNLDLQKLINNSQNKLRIIGNIPYNLTSSIIFKMIENNSIISDSVIMVQTEVAKRMAAGKGTKDYGILSILLNYFSEIKHCFRVSPNVFYPKPKVFSSVIHIYFKELSESKEEQRLFIKIVKAAFGNRRKTLKNSFENSLSSVGLENIDFESAGINLSLRAEQLTADDFKKLTKYVFKLQNLK
ncbi:MAG: 16S rRNA (adenine(1518)-N(6)/adenine(1519)-N(6))-dimethyltransferase RsmA [Ignavibacteriaceae bacterium]